MFLYFVILYAFQSAKYIKKRGWEGGLGEDKKEVKRMQRALAFIMALMTSLGFTVYGNLSLRMLFSTGAYQTVIAVFIGVWAYGAILKRQKERNRLMALALAFFIGSIVYAFFIGQRTRAGSWMDALFDLAVLAIFIGAMGFAAGGRGKAPAEPEISGVTSDVGLARKAASAGAKGLVKAARLAGAAGVGSAKLLGKLAKFSGRGAVSAVQRIMKKRAQKREAFETAYRMAAEGAPVDEIRKELSAKGLPRKFIEKALKSLPPKGGPIPPIPPLTPDDVEEELEELTVAQKDYEKIQGDVKAIIDASQKSLKELKSFFGEYEKLRAGEKRISEDLKNLKSLEMKRVTTLEALPETKPFVDEAQKLNADIEEVFSEFDNKSKSFRQKIESAAPFLSGADIQDLNAKLSEKLKALQSIDDGLKAHISSMEREGALVDANIQYFSAACTGQMNLKSEIEGILKANAGTPETIAKGMETAGLSMTELEKFLGEVQTELDAFGRRQEALNTKIKAITERKEPAKITEAGVLGIAGSIVAKSEELKEIVVNIEENMGEGKNLTKEGMELIHKLFNDALFKFSEIEDKKTDLAQTPETKNLGDVLSVFLSHDEGNIFNDLDNGRKIFGAEMQKTDMSEANKIAGPFIGIFKTARYASKLDKFKSDVGKIKAEIEKKLSGK